MSQMEAFSHVLILDLYAYDILKTRYAQLDKKMEFWLLISFRLEMFNRIIT